MKRFFLGICLVLLAGCSASAQVGTRPRANNIDWTDPVYQNMRLYRNVEIGDTTNTSDYSLRIQGILRGGLVGDNLNKIRLATNLVPLTPGFWSMGSLASPFHAAAFNVIDTSQVYLYESLAVLGTVLGFDGQWRINSGHYSDTQKFIIQSATSPALFFRNASGTGAWMAKVSDNIFGLYRSDTIESLMDPAETLTVLEIYPYTVYGSGNSFLRFNGNISADSFILAASETMYFADSGNTLKLMTLDTTQLQTTIPIHSPVVNATDVNVSGDLAVEGQMLGYVIPVVFSSTDTLESPYGTYGTISSSTGGFVMPGEGYLIGVTGCVGTAAPVSVSVLADLTTVTSGYYSASPFTEFFGRKTYVLNPGQIINVQWLTEHIDASITLLIAVDSHVGILD